MFYNTTLKIRVYSVQYYKETLLPLLVITIKYIDILMLDTKERTLGYPLLDISRGNSTASTAACV